MNLRVPTRLVVLPALTLLALVLVAGAAPAHAGTGPGPDGNLGVFTSAIDINGLRVQLVASAPHRDTGRPIDVPLPPGVLGPKMGALLATPVSTQLDQYWSATPDPKSGMTRREEACDGPEGIKKQVEKAVAKIGSSYHAYDISCDLASTGMLIAKQTGSTLQLGYLLTGNRVRFASATPYTCLPANGTVFCPNNPRFTVTFAVQLFTTIRTPGLCQLTAENGTVITQAVNIEGENFSASFAQLVAGSKFQAAEHAIGAAERQVPLPINAALAELREGDACTGKTPFSRVLTAFRDLETTIDLRQGIILRASHVGIGRPTLDAPNPGAAGAQVPSVPFFTRPMISTTQPLVTAGNAVQVNGVYFPPNLNFSTALPVTIDHGGYGENSVILGGVCFGSVTELEWGPAGGEQRVEKLPGGVQGQCAPTFQATNLTPATTYQFRARDCDLITCSPWSATLKVTTAAGDPNRGKVTLTLDNGVALGTATVNDKGTFEAPVTIPAGTAAGTHTIHAVSGDAKASVGVQVAASASTAKASLMIVGLLPGETGCPNNPLTSAQTDDTFRLFGAGFGPGTVTVRLDSATGRELGTATVRADGSFCADMKSPPASMAGDHTLVAVQDGAVKAQAPVKFVLPYVVR